MQQNRCDTEEDGYYFRLDKTVSKRGAKAQTHISKEQRDSENRYSHMWSINKDSKATKWRKDGIFNKWWWNNWTFKINNSLTLILCTSYKN